MRRRTAILLSGTLLLSIAGYVAWCLRMFYLTPRFEMDPGVSADGRVAVERWAGTAAYPGPANFDWEKACWNLGHPWDSGWFRVMRAWENPADGLWVGNGEELWGFSRCGGRWDSSTAADYGHIESSNYVFGQGEAANWLDAWVAGGEVTLEIRPLVGAEDLAQEGASVTDGGAGTGLATQDQAVAAGVAVQDAGERQELLEEFSRSIREAILSPGGADADFACEIILRRGEQKLEILINYVQGHGFARCSEVGEDEAGSHFRVGFRACESFNAFAARRRAGREMPVRTEAE